MANFIEPLHWNAILTSLSTKSCVPFLGAGVNVSTPQYRGLPLANEVVLHMVNRLAGVKAEDLRELIQNSNLSVKSHIEQTLAALRQGQGGDLIPEDGGPLPGLLRVTLPDLSRLTLQVQVMSGLRHLLDLVREILSDENIEPSPLLRVLGSMTSASHPDDPTTSAFKLIVTANYDSLLERAFQGKPHELVVQPISGFDERDQSRLQDRLSASEAPVLYKIHGSFNDLSAQMANKDDSPLVLTEEDYIRFLSAMGAKGVPNVIGEKLRDGTILFLGYSLQDWDFRTLYKTLIEPLPKWQRPRSYAIQLNPEAYWRDYWLAKEVTILNVDLYWFAEELEKRWHQKVHR
jgi:hypothetical protein